MTPRVRPVFSSECERTGRSGKAEGERVAARGGRGAGGKGRGKGRKGTKGKRGGRAERAKGRKQRPGKQERSARRMRLSDSVLRALEGGGALAQRALAKRIGLEAGREGRKRLERALRKLEQEGAVERSGATVRLARGDGSSRGRTAAGARRELVRQHGEWRSHAHRRSRRRTSGGSRRDPGRRGLRRQRSRGSGGAALRRRIGGRLRARPTGRDGRGAPGVAGPVAARGARSIGGGRARGAGAGQAGIARSLARTVGAGRCAPRKAGRSRCRFPRAGRPPPSGDRVQRRSGSRGRAGAARGARRTRQCRGGQAPRSAGTAPSSPSIRPRRAITTMPSSWSPGRGAGAFASGSRSPTFRGFVPEGRLRSIERRAHAERACTSRTVRFRCCPRLFRRTLAPSCPTRIGARSSRPCT